MWALQLPNDSEVFNELTDAEITSSAHGHLAMSAKAKWEAKAKAEFEKLKANHQASLDIEKQNHLPHESVLNAKRDSLAFEPEEANGVVKKSRQDTLHLEGELRKEKAEKVAVEVWRRFPKPDLEFIDEIYPDKDPAPEVESGDPLSTPSGDLEASPPLPTVDLPAPPPPP
ncbi:conserved hypothetical protein [Ricinus communis]|uniref:Clathrin light chain n=1 Tax=Ricinus communis TaxID=3988 RepID=B9RWE9_RICCO|nr:conserved hypothetical protein [Ricinus communis]